MTAILYRAGQPAEPTSGYLAMPLRTPAEALADSMAAAQRRLPLNRPAERMDGLTGVVLAIEPDGWQVNVLIELPDGAKVRESAGFWHGRSAL